MDKICKWLACSYVEQFDTESDLFCVCGYDMDSCIVCIATYNEHGVPICHLFSFADTWDDEMIDNCEFVSMTEIPFPLVRSVGNAFRLFSISVNDFFGLVWLGVQNYGFNFFDVDCNDNSKIEVHKS